MSTEATIYALTLIVGVALALIGMVKRPSSKYLLGGSLVAGLGVVLTQVFC